MTIITLDPKWRLRGAQPERLVLSEFSGQMISIESEAWRHECEVAFLTGLPIATQDELLVGRPGARDGDQGIRGARGEETVAMLRVEIERLAAIRWRRAAR